LTLFSIIYVPISLITPISSMVNIVEALNEGPTYRYCAPESVTSWPYFTCNEAQSEDILAGLYVPLTT
jgi:hypothetical protein